MRYTQIVLVLICLMTACTGVEPPSPNTYLVTFYGGGAIKSQIIPEGRKATRPANPERTGYACIFVDWYIDDAEESYDFKQPVNSDIKLYAKWRPYELGETGPAGGIIFYRSEGLISDVEYHYLEAAPNSTELPEAWASSGHETADITGANHTKLGSGKTNTAAILAIDAAAPAAQKCDTWIANGFSDWFLPSREELHELFLQKDLFNPPLENVTYYSSSQESSSKAWTEDFRNPVQIQDELHEASAKPKTDQYQIYPIRAF